MPRGDPFTQFCQQMARTDRAVVGDLHLHTTASDGDYTPSHVVALASVARLKAIALTDHDTCAGIAAAREAALQFPEPRRPEIIAGVEISSEFEGREVHILGLLVDPACVSLKRALGQIAESRVVRFTEFVEYFRNHGTPLDEGRIQATLAGTACPGRRHVAGLLVGSGVARSRYDAFQRFLGPALPSITPKALLPATDAIRLIDEAGGIASLAHPPADCDGTTMQRFHDLGLRAIEVEFPASTVSRTLELRTWAKDLGWAVTGGSDCHGSDRALGSRGVTASELAELRGRSG
jgi:predicted metal-dependent phosphoesterase TrpH